MIQIDLNPDAIDRFAPDSKSEQKASESADALGSLLSARWTEWAEARREKEEEWLQCLRAFNSQPEPDEPVDPNRQHHHIYTGITRTKVISAYARIVDLMFQASDPHWGIEPTPVPQLEQTVKLQVKQRILANPSLVFLNPVDRDEFVNLLAQEEHKEVQEEAHRRADAMASAMSDQLLELRYEDACKWSILQGCLLGTGAIKGITPDAKVEQHWQPTLVGGWDLVKQEIKAPKLDLVSVFDLYPDPYANRIEDAIGVFERHVLNRRQFAELRDNPMFDALKIGEILLAQSSKGSYTPLHHETERQRIAGNNASLVTRTDRFEVLEYWGTVPGDVLLNAGVDLSEDDEADLASPADPSGRLFWVNVWVSSGKTLLARMSPLKRQRVPYHFFPFFKAADGFWGVGVAWMMKHSQAAMNGLVRAMLDNAAAASGPQTEVNIHMLAAKDKADLVIKPWKIWLRDAGDPAIPAVRFYQPEIIVAELERMLDLFRKFADEETSLPSYTHGEEIPGLNKTASGTSMLMSAANVTLKAVIKNLEDGMIRPLLQSLFDWNMEWNEDPDIKGDLDVDVRGSSALIAKEMQSQRLIQFAAMTANPVDLQFIDREKLLREVAQSMDLNPDKIWRESGQIAGPGGVAPLGAAGMGGAAPAAGGTATALPGPVDVAEQSGGNSPDARPMHRTPAVAEAA